MSSISTIKKIDQKIAYYSNWIDTPDIFSRREAIVLYFVYKNEIDQINKNTLVLFLKSHLSFNDKCVIFIYTNLNLNLKEFDKKRLIINFLPFQDKETMTNKVVFNYVVTKKFFNFDKLFFFDHDLIPLTRYKDFFKFNFDVGLTYNSERQRLKKYIVNAGFIIINNHNIDAINIYNQNYLNSYIKILDNEKKLQNKFKLKKPLSEWYGDQMLYYCMLKNIPEKNFTYFDYKLYDYHIRLHNDYIYNYPAYELKDEIKNPKKSFDISEFLKLCKEFPVYFIHLKGDRKIFSKDISSHLNLN